MIKKTIKINGIKYIINIKDYCKIKLIRVRLLIRRVYRWNQLFHFSDIIIGIMLVLIWGLVWLFIYKTLSFNAENEWPSFIMNVTSSVIVVGFIGLATRIARYRNVNKEQYYFYYDIKEALNSLFSAYYGDMIYHYEPFYSDETIKQTFSLVKNMRVPMSKKEILFYTQILLKRLEELSNHLMMRSFNNCDEEDLKGYINLCERYILAISEDKRAMIRSYFEDLIFCSWHLLDELGKTWRKDHRLDKEIYTILIKNGYDCLDNYYVRMKFYSFWEIKDYLTKDGKKLYIGEEDRLVYLTFMEMDYPGENDSKHNKPIKDFDNRRRKQRLFDRIR